MSKLTEYQVLQMRKKILEWVDMEIECDCMNLEEADAAKSYALRICSAIQPNDGWLEPTMENLMRDHRSLLVINVKGATDVKTSPSCRCSVFNLEDRTFHCGTHCYAIDAVASYFVLPQ